MVRTKKNTALSRENKLNEALKQENVIDMRSFFDSKQKKEDDYWMAAMVLCIDNISTEQKIRLARKIIRKKAALNFFFDHLHDID
jgi:hypothetical protein